jgi:putative sterol carrier protein
MMDVDRLQELLGANPDFSSSTRFFDGAIQLHLGGEKVWIKAFMGRAILVTQEIPPFGYTFAISGAPEDWGFALGGPKNRFREAIVTGRLAVEGNQMEFSRIARAVHGLSQVLMDMLRDGSMRLAEGS